MFRTMAFAFVVALTGVSAADAGGCHCGTTPTGSAAVARTPAAANRMYSYDPAPASGARRYTAPSRSRSKTPVYLLPKGDPRRYNGF